MDKQIIVDGVDVSGCGYYANDKCINSNILQSNCKNVAVCYYKEYKRKEQECEEFRKANDEKNELLAQLGCPTVGTARRLTLSLKEQLEAYKMEAEEGKEINAELKATNEDLLSIQYKLADSNLKLRQTLAEIKEIAEPFCNACLEFEPEKNCNNCIYCNYGNILQKISEVEE